MISKYDDVNRVESKVIAVTPTTKNEHSKNSKLRSVLIRSICALLLVLAILVGKYSGVSNLKKVSDEIVDAICYDPFDFDGKQDKT